jgi:preprotein translocase subunit SecE
MAKAKSSKSKKKSSRKDNAVFQYLRETRAELRKVHWPTREEAWNLTKIVLIVTVSMALFLGLLDYLFSIELRGLVAGNVIAIGVIVALALVGAVVALILSRQTAR